MIVPALRSSRSAKIRLFSGLAWVRIFLAWADPPGYILRADPLSGSARPKQHLLNRLRGGSAQRIRQPRSLEHDMYPGRIRQGKSCGRIRWADPPQAKKQAVPKTLTDQIKDTFFTYTLWGAKRPTLGGGTTQISAMDNQAWLRYKGGVPTDTTILR